MNQLIGVVLQVKTVACDLDREIVGLTSRPLIQEALHLMYLFRCLQDRSDLAAVLLKAWEAGQTGVLHIAGAERINPCQFAVRVASLAGLENPTFDQQARLSRPLTGFGRGETMLDCRKARRVLGVPMPMIDEGIGRMLEQRENGFLAQLRSEAATATRVA